MPDSVQKNDERPKVKEPKAAMKAKPSVSVEAFQALSSRFDALEERFNRLVKSHRFQF